MCVCVCVCVCECVCGSTHCMSEHSEDGYPSQSGIEAARYHQLRRRSARLTSSAAELTWTPASLTSNNVRTNQYIYIYIYIYIIHHYHDMRRHIDLDFVNILSKFHSRSYNTVTYCGNLGFCCIYRLIFVKYFFWCATSTCVRTV